MKTLSAFLLVRKDGAGDGGGSYQGQIFPLRRGEHEVSSFAAFSLAQLPACDGATLFENVSTNAAYFSSTLHSVLHEGFRTAIEKCVRVLGRGRCKRHCYLRTQKLEKAES